jgi:redox-sensitive bicupin YhaK (pirin superfamily)
MEDARSIRKVWKGKSVVKGNLVQMKRAIGFPNDESLDPFLVLDDVHSDASTKWFPWHPHRGIESITYMLRGEIDHIDSMGNGGTIRSGDALWIATGRGIIHQEMLRRDSSGSLRVIQLLVDIPSSSKKLPPCYHEIKSSQIPELLLDNGVTVRIVSGEVGGVTGPVRDIGVGQEYLDVTVPPHVTFVHPAKKGFTTFAYVVEGTGYFTPEPNAGTEVSKEANRSDGPSFCEAETLVLLSDCDEVVIAAAEQQLRFLLVTGRPTGDSMTQRPPALSLKSETTPIKAT